MTIFTTYLYNIYILFVNLKLNNTKNDVLLVHTFVEIT